MKVILDDIIDKELKTYLLTQDGVKNVELIDNGIYLEINVDFNNKTNPNIIMNYIYLFQENKLPIMVEFNKKNIGNKKILKYKIDDLCCEYCYKNFIESLFENKFVNSVKTDYKFDKPLYNIEFIIEYDNTYEEIKLIEYINEEINYDKLNKKN